MKEKHKYMVVDDDLTNNLICEFTIRRFNAEADINLFTKPEKALVTIKEDYNPGTTNRPVILFLDINMPTMTGWEFLDVFQKFEQSTKDQFIIYILSSSIEDFSKEAKIYTSIKGFLSKPLKITNLEEIEKDL